MAWIESHQELARHPKTRKLARILGESIPTVIGHLHLLWWWAMDYAQDGDLSRYEPEDIADAGLWEGEATAFVEALIKAGFIDQDGERLVIHDWHEYAGRLLDQRQRAAEQKRRHRELYNNKALIQAIRERDKDRCRYCGRPVNWKDRKGPDGATYDYIDPNGPTSLENVVVACRACNAGKGQRTPEEAGYVLLLPPTEYLQKSTHNPGNIKSESTLTIPNQTIPNQTKIKNISSSPAPSAPAENEGQEPVIQPKSKKKAAQEDYTPEFEQFWAVYPKKVEKQKAFRLWKTRRKEGLTAEDLVNAAKNYAAFCRRQGTEYKFIKYPTTFLGPDKPFLDWIRPGEEDNSAADRSNSTSDTRADPPEHKKSKYPTLRVIDGQEFFG